MYDDGGDVGNGRTGSAWYRDRSQLVARLRESHGDGGSDGPADPTILGPAAPSPEAVGHYRIRRVIASGGMGTVYEAVQDHPRRSVAVKVLKRGIASRSAIRRFDYESRALARLRHPGIAQIYEANTYDDGAGEVPFFAMEYVPNARPITQYARDEELPLRRRLDLFIEVCDAVHHSHQRGIIHRDLKPGNVLIDADGRAKIIDFGVARGTDLDITVTTLQTSVGQLVGTLQYMSPEQCAADPDDLDLRSDVYSLGVVLYELVSDRLPYDVSGTSILESTRIVREEQPTRLAAIDARLRGDLENIVLKALEKDRDKRYQSTSDLSRDLSRYLNDEPVEARPPSALYVLGKFARRNRVALTCAALILLTVIAGLIVGGVLVSKEQRRTAAALTTATENLHAAEKQRAKATASFRLARDAVDQMLVQVADELPHLPGMQDPQVSPEVERLRKTLLEEALAFYLEFLEDESADPVVRFETGHAFFRVAQITQKLKQYRRSEETYLRAIELLDELSDECGEDREYGEILAGSYRGLGEILMATGRPAEAEHRFRRAVELRASLAERDRDHPSHVNDLTWDWSGLGRSLHQLGRKPEAEHAYRQSVDLGERLVADDPERLEHRNSLGWHYSNLSEFLFDGTRSEEALAFGRKAVELFEQLRSEAPNPWHHEGWAHAMTRMSGHFGRHRDVALIHQSVIDTFEELASRFPTDIRYRITLADSLEHYANVLHYDFRDDSGARTAFERAATLRREIAATIPTTENLESLESAESCLDEFRESITEPATRRAWVAQSRDIVRRREQLLNEAPGSVEYREQLCTAVGYLANALWFDHRIEEAEAQYRRSLAMRKELLAEVPSWHFYRYGVAHTQTWFADLLLHTGRLSEAEAMLSEAIGRFEGLIAEALGNCQTNRRLAICYEMLGEVLWITDRPDDAKQAMRRAVILMERNAADYPEWNRFKLHLLRVLANSPDPEIRDPARAVELARDVLDRAPDNSDGWLYLGVAHLHLGEWQSAATALERSMELEPEVIEFHSQHYSFQLFGLAIARWQLGEAEAARELYDEAVETMLEESAGLGPDWVPRLKIRRLHDRARAIFEDGADGATAPDSPVGR